MAHTFYCGQLDFVPSRHTSLNIVCGDQFYFLLPFDLLFSTVCGDETCPLVVYCKRWSKILFDFF